MLLQEVTISGLRGYAEPVTVGFAVPNGQPGSGLTVIVGPNNSGKSTLVEVFRLRRAWGAPSFNVGMRNRATDAVHIRFKFEGHTETIDSIRAGSSEAKVDKQDTKKAPVYFVPSRRYFSPAFGRGSLSDRNTFMDNYSSSTDSRSPHLSQFEGRLLQIERDQELFNQVMKRVVPDLLKWSIDQHETGQYFLKFQSEDKSHSSEGVGEGIVSAFVIVAALYDSAAGDVVVIDEPELSLHPQIQRRLIALIEDYTADRQIILATHSPYFITKRAIDGGLTIARCWDRDGTIQVHTSSASDSTSTLKKLAGANINNPHVFGLDAREVFFLEDGVLVFEGQEDVVLWPEVTAQLRAPSFQIYGWGAGGAENIRHVLGIFRELGFRRVAAVFDADKERELNTVRELFPEYYLDMIPADDIRTKRSLPAREKKLGLLDESRQIRAQYVEACSTLVANLASAIG